MSLYLFLFSRINYTLYNLTFLEKYLFIFIYVHLSVSLWMFGMCECEASRKTVSPLELELQTVMGHPTWVLEARLRSSGEQQVLVTVDSSIHPHMPFNYNEFGAMNSPPSTYSALAFQFCYVVFSLSFCSKCCIMSILFLLWPKIYVVCHNFQTSIFWIYLYCWILFEYNCA